MWFLLDILVVLIIAFNIFRCYKRGFVRTIIELVGYFLAIYLSFTLSAPISNVVYDSFVGPKITDEVASGISLSSGSSIEETVNVIWETLPEIVVKNTEISKDSLQNTIIDNNSTTDASQVIAKSATDSIVKPVLIPIIQTVVSVILFFLLMFIIKFLAKVINKVFSLPIIGKLNKLLGGIIGCFKGTLFATIFVMIIVFIISITENGFLFFTNENIEKTIFFKILAGFIPF